MSNLNTDLKSMFTAKLKTFYQCKLKDSLFKLTELFDRVPALNDDYTLEIKQFQSRLSK